MKPGRAHLHLPRRLIHGLGLILLSACVNASPNESNTGRDINAVLRAHDHELLQLPNVVGVCVALLPDNKTLCLKVMLSRATAETERRLPKTIEGYPVITEITGEFRPLKQDPSGSGK